MPQAEAQQNGTLMKQADAEQDVNPMNLKSQHHVEKMDHSEKKDNLQKQALVDVTSDAGNKRRGKWAEQHATNKINQITMARVQSILAEAERPEHKAVSENLKEVGQFYLWVLEKFGYLVRLWRTLDRDLNMTLTHNEFLIGLRAQGFPGNSRHLVKVFDRMNTGTLYYRFYDPVGALKLAFLKSWAIEKFGSLPALFKAFDDDGNGRLTIKEFSRQARKHNLSDDHEMAAAILFNMLDKDSDHKIEMEELDFLGKWHQPEWLNVEPDHEGADTFKRKMIEYYHNNPILAWILGLDEKWAMCISWEDFLKINLAKRKKPYLKTPFFQSIEKEDLLRIWRALDPNLSGWLSLREFSINAYNLITFFKQWCVKNHGSIKKMMNSYDENESGMLSRKEFFKLVAPKLSLGEDKVKLPDEDIEILFAGLDQNGGDTIKTSDIERLDDWNAEGDVKFERMWAVVFNSLCPRDPVTSAPTDSGC
jgi:Ca2+-binding EF-hand superfamily protein